MCGVAAIYAYHPAAVEVQREELRKIRDHMAARGPDAAGEWYTADHRVGLGHRRLSIIDLSERATQPMVTEDGSLAVSFNGEIYNYRELRKELEQEGYRFRSDSDTEVLLALYARDGTDMVRRLRGMFGFVLWDRERSGMLLARDPYGIKPLYYADDGWTLRVASQVRALHAGGRVAKTREPAGVAGFFLFGSVPEPFTLYQEVRAVPAGTTIWVDQLGPEPARQFYSIASVYHHAGSDRHADTNRLQLIGSALRDSIRAHLVSDVPVGAFLSAGIDSSTILALAAEDGTGVVPASVTLAFEEYRNTGDDESSLAREVASQCGSTHQVRMLGRDEFRSELPRILAAMDQPSIDGVNSWFVSKAAAEQGMKVALSGIGGDELFGGYPSFQDVPSWARWFALPSRIPFMADTVRTAGSVVLPEVNPKLYGLLKYGGSHAGAWFVRRGLFMPWELPALIGEEQAHEGWYRLRVFRSLRDQLRPDPGCNHARVATLETTRYLRNQLLRDTDWASMAHSLEVRTPLVDAELLASLAAVTKGIPHGEGKRDLARTPRRPLPDTIVHREKTGFTVPIRDWIDTQLDSWKAKTLLCRPGCHWSRRWAWSVFEGMAAS